MSATSGSRRACSWVSNGWGGVVRTSGGTSGGRDRSGIPDFPLPFFLPPPSLFPPSSLPCPSGPGEQPTSGHLVPSGSTDLEMMADSHDYDEVPMEDTTEEEEVGW